MMTGTDLAFLPATELATQIRLGAVSPVEAIEAAIVQIEALNPIVNAVCTVDSDSARAAAVRAEAAQRRGDPLGPLHGLPIGLKDLTETANLRTTYGSRLYEHNVPVEDALLVRRLKAAGGIVIGKTNAPEFAA